MRQVTTAKVVLLLIGVITIIGLAWIVSPTPGVVIVSTGFIAAALLTIVRDRPRPPPPARPVRVTRPSTGPLATRPVTKPDQWRRMARLSTVLNGTLDPQQALDLVSRAFAELTNADGTAVFIQLDDAAHTLALARSTGFSAALRHDPAPPLSLGHGMVVSNAFIVQNASTDLRAEPIRAALTEAHFVSWVELPLSAAGSTESFGALVAYYKEQRPFPPDEIEPLRLFADHAASAIRNSQIHRRTSHTLDQRVAQLLALAAINQELTSTLDPQNLFARVLDYALDGTTSVGGALLLRPEAMQTVASNDEPTLTTPRIVAQRGQDIRKTDDFLSRLTISEAFETNEPVIDRSQLPELSVPISRGKDVLGVITLYAVEKDAFSPDDVLFVRYLATQAVIAVDNARLFKRIEDLSLIHI